MNKTFLTLVLSSLVLSACGPTASTTVNNLPSPQSTTVPKVAQQSLRELIGLGLTQKCTWSSTDSLGQSMSGEILMKGKQFKQTSLVTVEGKPMNSTMISDGTYFYTWTNSTKANGIKMAIPTPSAAASPAADKNLDNKYNYNCSPATVSDADFVLPSDVKFTDLSEIQNSLQKLDLNKLKQQFGQ
jgi:hypothetical protein